MQSTQPAKYADHLDASARQQPTKITGVECTLSRGEIEVNVRKSEVRRKNTLSICYELGPDLAYVCQPKRSKKHILMPQHF